MIPVKYEAALRAGKEAKAEKALRRVVRLSPDTKIKFKSLPKGTVATARPEGMGRGKGTMSFDPAQGHSIPTAARHERAHLAPKRNSVRFAERMDDPARAGREEARASHLAGHSGRYGTGSPQEDRLFRAGFDEVTRKMKAAGTKSQLNKRFSPFGVVW